MLVTVQGPGTSSLAGHSSGASGLLEPEILTPPKKSSFQKGLFCGNN